MLNSLLCTQQSTFCNVSVLRDLLQAPTVSVRLKKCVPKEGPSGPKRCGMMIVVRIENC